MDQTSFFVDFNVNNDGNWHNYYVALWPHYKGLISQIRFHPVIPDSKESLERTEYRCLNAASGNTDRNEVLISNTAIPTTRECNVLCGKTSQCVAALHDKGRCIMYSRCQPMVSMVQAGL